MKGTIDAEKAGHAPKDSITEEHNTYIGRNTYSKDSWQEERNRCIKQAVLISLKVFQWA